MSSSCDTTNDEDKTLILFLHDCSLYYLSFTMRNAVVQQIQPNLASFASNAPELLSHILDYLPVEEKASARLVCKTWDWVIVNGKYFA